MEFVYDFDVVSEEEGYSVPNVLQSFVNIDQE
jgi:hypothetical protein